MSSRSFDDMDELAKDALADYLPGSGMLFARKVPGIASRLRAKLQAMREARFGIESRETNMSPSTEDALRALGYVQ